VTDPPGRLPPASAADTTSSSGLDPNVAAMLAYLAWWVTGLIFYIIERDNRFVRFHAAQSIVAFGAISILGIALMMASFVLLFVWASGFQVLMWLSQIVMLAGLIVWAVCLFKAFNGEYYKLPVVGDFAERIAARS
jgi:uncharacterized membrane protein